MNVNPTPKERFQAERENLVAHRSLLDLPAFERGCDVALLELARRLPNRETHVHPRDLHHQMVGAVEFVKILRALAETTPAGSQLVMDNLNHKA